MTFYEDTRRHVGGSLDVLAKVLHTCLVDHSLVLGVGAQLGQVHQVEEDEEHGGGDHHWLLQGHNKGLQTLL